MHRTLAKKKVAGLAPKSQVNVKLAPKTVFDLIKHNSNAAGDPQGFRTKIQKTGDLSANLTGKMSARVCCMLGAIKKACYHQLNTPGNYNKFSPALLSVLVASQETVTEAKESSKPWNLPMNTVYRAAAECKRL